MQAEISTQIYISKENVSTQRTAKANAKPRREFGRELLNVERTPAQTQTQPSTAQSTPLKALFVPETADRDSVLAYAEPIGEHCRSRAASLTLAKDYLAVQNDITPKMRSILVDWLADVSHKFRLSAHTLFATVNTLDRYLAVAQVEKTQLQLLGATCLSLQAKMEEVYPPAMDAYLAVCDNAYSADQLLEMEGAVLNALGFDISQPSSLYFLQLSQLTLQLERKPLAFARYILETSLLDANGAKYSNATLAAGAVFLVLKIFKLGAYTQQHAALFGCGDADVRAAAKDLYLCLQRIDASSLSAVKRKFATAEFCEVSKFKIEKQSGSKQ